MITDIWYFMYIMLIILLYFKLSRSLNAGLLTSPPLKQFCSSPLTTVGQTIWLIGSCMRSPSGTNNNRGLSFALQPCVNAPLLHGHSWRQANQTYCSPHWPWEGAIVCDTHDAPSLPLCVRWLDESVLRGLLFMKWGRSWLRVSTLASVVVIETLKPCFTFKREIEEVKVAW